MSQSDVHINSSDDDHVVLTVEGAGSGSIWISSVQRPPLRWNRPQPRPAEPSKRTPRDRYPWEVDMTLCIAASSFVSVAQGPKVVISFDRRIETFVAGAEIEFKFMFLSDRWVALYASNDLAETDELIRRYQLVLKRDEASITRFNVVDTLRKPVTEMRASLADRLTQSRVALSYETFVTRGKDMLDAEIHKQLGYDITQQHLASELLLIGAPTDQNGLEIYRYCWDGVKDRVDHCPHFAAIGSGSTIAEAILFWRRHSNLRPLGKALYAVYEAHKIGSIAPGVSEEHNLAILSYDAEDDEIKVELLADTGDAFLEEKFKAFGPKSLGKCELPNDALYDPLEK